MDDDEIAAVKNAAGAVGVDDFESSFFGLRLIGTDIKSSEPTFASSFSLSSRVERHGLEDSGAVEDRVFAGMRDATVGVGNDAA